MEVYACILYEARDIFVTIYFIKFHLSIHDGIKIEIKNLDLIIIS